MKTTFKAVFDEFDYELADIENNNTADIDTDRIKSKVLAQIRNKHIKHNTSKKITALLIAAAILLVGTVGVFATRSIGDVFGSLFHKGSNLNALGLYDAKNVEINCADDSLNVKLLGITGDHNKRFASIEITKKDGSEVVDKNYTHPQHLRAKEYVTEKDGETWPDYSFKYELLNDNKTLMIYTDQHAVEKNQMERITVICEAIRVARFDEFLYSKDAPIDQLTSPSEEEADAERKELMDLLEERGNPNEECFSTYNNGKRYYYIGEAKFFDIPFEISFDIDIDYNEDLFITKELTNREFPNLICEKAEKAELKVTPVSVYVTATCSLDSIDTKNESLLITPHWDDSSKVILKDGTTYNLYAYVDSGSEIDEKNGIFTETLSLNLSTVIGPAYYVEKNAIDTRDVDMVIINNEVVYVKD